MLLASVLLSKSRNPFSDSRLEGILTDVMRRLLFFPTG